MQASDSLMQVAGHRCHWLRFLDPGPLAFADVGPHPKCRDEVGKPSLMLLEQPVPKRCGPTHGAATGHGVAVVERLHDMFSSQCLAG